MLKTTVTLERQTVTKDLGGAAGRTWATVTADIACDIQPANSSIQLNYSQRQLEVSHVIYFANDVGALATDRFVSGSRVFKIVGYSKAAPGRGSWPAKADVLEVPQS